MVKGDIRTVYIKHYCVVNGTDILKVKYTEQELFETVIIKAYSLKNQANRDSSINRILEDVIDYDLHEPSNNYRSYIISEEEALMEAIQ